MIPNTKMLGGGKFLFLDNPSGIKSTLNVLSEMIDIVHEISNVLDKDNKNIIVIYNMGVPNIEEIPKYISDLYPVVLGGNLCMFVIRIYAIGSQNRISIWVEPAWNPSEYICKGVFRGTENQLMWYKIPTIKI